MTELLEEQKRAEARLKEARAVVEHMTLKLLAIGVAWEANVNVQFTEQIFYLSCVGEMCATRYTDAYRIATLVIDQGLRKLV